MVLPFINLLEGILIGIVISIPLGPVALITMKRTAQYGLRAGVISGLAIALIDTIFGIIVLLFIGKSLSFVHHLPEWIYRLGGIILLFYGLRMSVSPPVCKAQCDKPWHQHFASSVILTLTNPSTYVSFGVIGLLLTRFIERSLFARIEVVIGFFAGAFLWWCMLAWIAFSQRERYLTAGKLQSIVGIIIMILALSMIILGPLRGHGQHLSTLVGKLFTF